MFHNATFFPRNNRKSLTRLWKCTSAAMVANAKKITLATAFTSACGLFAYLMPSEKLLNTEPDIPGKWFGTYSYPITNGTVEISGTTEYFKNHRYNFTGQLAMRSVKNGEALYALYSVMGSGEWHADSDAILINLEDLKSRPVSVVYKGMPIDLSGTEAITRRKFPRIEDTVPTMMGDEFRIIDRDEKTLLLEADAPTGETFQFSMTRHQGGEST